VVWPLVEAGEPSGPTQQEWRRLVQKYAEMHVPAWLCLYSFRGGFSIRCHCKGLAEAAIGSAMGPRWPPAERYIQRSYRVLIEGMKARAFESSAAALPLASTPGVTGCRCKSPAGVLCCTASCGSEGQHALRATKIKSNYKQSINQRVLIKEYSKVLKTN